MGDLDRALNDEPREEQELLRENLERARECIWHGETLYEQQLKIEALCTLLRKIRDTPFSYRMQCQHMAREGLEELGYE